MKKITKIFLAFISVALFTACEKKFDKNFDTAFEEKTVMINYATEEQPAPVGVTPPASGNIELDLGNVSISTPGENKTEITVTLRVNPTLIADYNTANGTNFQQFNPTAIDLPLVIKIPAGQKQAKIKATVNPALINLSNSYAIPLSIATVTGGDGVTINPLYKDCMFAILVKNKYDGHYRLTGNSMLDVLNANFVGFYPIDFDFVTISADEVELVDRNYLGFPGHIFSNAGTLTYYGSFGMRFKFDPSNDKLIAVTNAYGQMSGPVSRSALIDPTGINQWNPANKNLKCKYFLQQFAAATLAGSNFVRVKFDENFNYIGPR